MLSQNLDWKFMNLANAVIEFERREQQHRGGFVVSVCTRRTLQTKWFWDHVP